jgi:serine/threonine-protein kinase
VTSVAGGRYRLDERIAAGGMGEVWRGHDETLGRTVAVKLLHANLSDDPVFRARFEAEARHAAALHDPHIATVFDYGNEADAGGGYRSYLVMEYVDGRPLSQLLRGPMPPEHVVSLLGQAAGALGAAHAAGIVHRDVKPANFLVTPDGMLKITDFGVARARGASHLTDTGTVVGTPAYVAPEVAEGREATPLSDIYSLGVVLYECLAGRRPFVADNPVAVALAHLREEPPPLPDTVPAHLRELTMRAMAKAPQARPQSAAEFAAVLRGDADLSPTVVAPLAGMAAASGEDPTALLTGVATSSGDADDGGRRGIWWVVLGVAAAIVLIAAAAIALSGDDNDPVTPAGTTPGAAGTPTQQGPSTPESRDPTTDEPTTSAPTTSAPSTPATTPETTAATTPEEVGFVDPEELIGQDAKDAQATLRDLGFKSRKESVQGGDRNVVVDVQPSGELPLSTEITLFVGDGTDDDGDGNGNEGPGGEGNGSD